MTIRTAMATQDQPTMAAISQVCEDLEEALHTAEVHSRPRPWPFNRIPYCRLCGALARENSGGAPREKDDGILHDESCVLVVLPAVIGDLKKVIG